VVVAQANPQILEDLGELEEEEGAEELLVIPQKVLKILDQGGAVDIIRVGLEMPQSLVVLVLL
jgi:hypothetical protein